MNICVRMLPLLALPLALSLPLSGCGGDNGAGGSGDGGGNTPGTTPGGSGGFRTVTIGTQTWAAENLNVAAAGSGCYGDSAANCEKYGRLYTWAAAKTACPGGWHLPNIHEWRTLIDYAGGRSTAAKKLKAASGWNRYLTDTGGSDDYGFSALPGGRRSGDKFITKSFSGFWWTSVENHGDTADVRYISAEGDYVDDVIIDKADGASVRCLKDGPAVAPVYNNTCGKDGTDGSCNKVTIGTRTWMAENLNRETAGSWCYQNNPDSCTKYGRLYTWSAALTACPSGWHLPSSDEWGALAIAAGGSGKNGTVGAAGKALKSTGGWYKDGNGTDEFGFTALPGDMRYPNGGFSYSGDRGYWWASTEYSETGANSRQMQYDSNAFGEYAYGVDKTSGLSVRCVAN